MNAIADDPFAAVIDDLETSLSSAKGLVPPLQTATGVVGDLHSGLSALGDIDSVLKALREMVLLLDGAALALAPVPGIGELAIGFEESVLAPTTTTLADLSKTYDAIYRDAIKPAIKVLADVKAGLSRITTVVEDVTITVPQVLNTVQVMSYLLDIAVPLTDLLKGSEAGARLHGVVSEMKSVRDRVGTALTPFAAGMKVIAADLAPFAEDLQRVFAAIGDGAKEAMGCLKKVGDKLKPIADGFHKALDAVAPVRWALKAVECIVDKILRPVVEWILKVTGLESLLDGIKDKIEEWLGIKPILEAVRKNVKPEAMSSSGGSVNSEAGTASAAAFGDLCLALGKYRTDKSEALKDLTFGLVSAITGTAVDPTRPCQLPPWPKAPPLDGNDAQAAGVLSAVLGAGGADARSELRAGFARVASVHSEIASRGARRPMSLLALAVQVEPPPVAAIDAQRWPRSAAFVAAVNDAVGSVVSLSHAVETLGESLESFRGSLVLPQQFAAQMSALQTSLQTCDDLVRLLAGFNVAFIDKLLFPVDAVVERQLSDARDVNRALPELKAAVQSLSAAAESVVAEMPNAGVVELAVHRMDGWVLGLQQLVAAMEAGADRQDANPSKLEAGRQHIEASAGALADRLEVLAASVRSMAGCVAELQRGLDAYSSALGSLSAFSEGVSTKSMPSIQHIAVILGKIDSIFDPLACVLKAEGCVDAQSAAKTWAQAARTLMVNAAEGAAQPPDSYLSVIEDFASSALPLGRIETAVKHAAALISSGAVEAFRSHAQTLGTNLSMVKKAIEQTQQYTWTDPDTGRRYELPNDLVNQEFVDQARGLVPAPASP